MDAHYRCLRIFRACARCGQSKQVVARHESEALLSPAFSAACALGDVLHCDRAKVHVFSAASGCDCVLCCCVDCTICVSLSTTSGTTMKPRSGTTAKSCDWHYALCASPSVRRGGLEEAKTHATDLSEHCGWGCYGCGLRPDGGRASASATRSDDPFSVFGPNALE